MTQNTGSVTIKFLKSEGDCLGKGEALKLIQKGPRSTFSKGLRRNWVDPALVQKPY